MASVAAVVPAAACEEDAARVDIRGGGTPRRGLHLPVFRPSPRGRAGAVATQETAAHVNEQVNETHTYLHSQQTAKSSNADVAAAGASARTVAKLASVHASVLLEGQEGRHIPSKQRLRGTLTILGC